jgi:hypothetical protein
MIKTMAENVSEHCRLLAYLIVGMIFWFLHILTAVLLNSEVFLG